MAADSENQGQDQSVALGVFAYRDKAESAIAELREAGFPEASIGIMQQGPRIREDNASDVIHQMEDSTAAGAVTGAGMGALWALGIVSGVLPAIGPIVAGGMLASLLAGAVSGAAAGGLMGMLIGLGLSESEARNLESAISKGGVIVTVRAGDRFDEATRILEAHGATGTHSRPIAPRPMQPAISNQSPA